MAIHSSTLGKSHGQRSLAGYSPWGCKESDTTEQLNDNTTQLFDMWFRYFFIQQQHIKPSLPYLSILTYLYTTCHTVWCCTITKSSHWFKSYCFRLFFEAQLLSFSKIVYQSSGILISKCKYSRKKAREPDGIRMWDRAKVADHMWKHWVLTAWQHACQWR